MSDFSSANLSMKIRTVMPTEAERFAQFVSRIEVCLNELKGMPAPQTKAEALYVNQMIHAQVEALDTAVGFVVYAQRAK